MEFSDGQLQTVLRHASPIEQYACKIAEAHSLGYGPGEHTDIWSVEFQRKAQKVWKQTLPPLFQRQVADSYKHCAWLMDSVSPDESAAGDWEKVATYLGGVSAAIDEDPDCAEHEVPSGSPDIGQMPEVIHYERLAELMHPDAAERLRAAASAVVRFCRFNLSIAPDEIQLACLQGLTSGEKHADLAKRLGYSERHLQRVLAAMWQQFGVDDTIQGVAFAVENGWIAVPSSNQ